MLAKKRINRNKLDNKARPDNKNIDFMLFTQDISSGNNRNKYDTVTKTVENIEF